ncbi:DUF2794 domain-containing protein [Fretibacter rubidus]|uniref:DUF2794 domain-containing protein n=1 Tax=Fretibacter rubidus TaxID=570162 RepID=UPI00352A0094
MSSKIVSLKTPKNPNEPRRIFAGQKNEPSQTAFDRRELSIILSVYGQMVSQGEWKDYAMDFLKDKAVFSVFRRATEHPLYRIEKTPALRDKQGQFSVIAPGGLILKRGHDLRTVLRVFDKQRFKSV